MSVVDLASTPRAPDERAAHYARLLDGKSAREVLDFALGELWPGRLAVVSSFGAESAVLLHVVSTIDKAAPVIFLETDRHFAQTLQYREELVERLGLTNVQDRKPDPAEAAAEDSRGDLWRKDPDACCTLRKVRPLTKALEGYDAWVTGRKRFQGGLRSELALIEHDGSHYKVNPLANWKAEEIAAYMAAHDLPQHPLVAQGFPSIGCWPCTKPAAAQDRSGRWADSEKTECGIHLPAAKRLHAH
ncbi:MAG TPA: phosphoadenylyl-sulfate reductase [Hyphomicrobiaceae bacterium]|nr:phosphoadenylyl-sulfate reductase [Hyphomicrobiaceae bacterium]